MSTDSPPPSARARRRPRSSRVRAALLALAAGLGAAAAIGGCGGSGDTPPPASPPPAPAPAATEVKAVAVLEGLENPWSLAFLPDGRMLVTERPGRLRVVSADRSTSTAVSGVPPVFASGQGGLLDVTPGPDFARDGLIYFSYAEPTGQDPSGAGQARAAVARARLDGNALADVEVIFRQRDPSTSTVHFGSRLVFARDGTLFVTLGDRGDRDRAQRLDSHYGKILRINADGSAPADNPFVTDPQALPEIWSYGHRNVQGAALHPETGKLWSNEHGPQGGDEVNVGVHGGNFGWPLYTYGDEYGTGAPIGLGETARGIEAPVWWWVPISIAPSGMIFYTGDRYPGWKGSAFVGALAGKMLVRLTLDGERVVAEQRLLTGLGERIRDVRQGPDGWLYVLTDSATGRLLRLEPL